jgi:hypothetical protein
VGVAVAAAVVVEVVDQAVEVVAVECRHSPCCCCRQRLQVEPQAAPNEPAT